MRQINRRNDFSVMGTLQLPVMTKMSSRWRFRRFFLTQLMGVSLLVTAMTVFLATPSNTQPLDSCRVHPSSRACDGRDPVKQGCEQDATTLASKNILNGVIELRYSAKCLTKWARTTSHIGKAATIYASIETGWVEGRGFQSVWRPFFSLQHDVTSTYTPMTTALQVDACGTISNHFTERIYGDNNDCVKNYP